MDRNTLIATVLIAIIMFVWLFVLAPPPVEPQLTPDNPLEDTVGVVPPVTGGEAQPSEVTEAAPAITDSTLAGAMQGEARIITVDSDLYEAKFSTHGATLVSFRLKKFLQFDQETPVQIVDTTGAGALGLTFTTPASHVVDTRSFFFEPSTARDQITVAEDGSVLTFEAKVGEGILRQTYTFTPDSYEVGMRIEQENASSFITPTGYELSWYGALPFSESPKNYNDEAIHMGVYARSGGEVEGFSLTEEGFDEKTLRGDVSWIAVKNKYFTAAIIPDQTPLAAELTGERAGTADAGTLIEDFTASLLMPTIAEADAYRLYLGPLEFYRISSYDLGLYGMVDYGWDAFEWMTRPLAKFVFIPAFTFLSTFIPNYGIVIIVFAILIKLILFPLTKSSYRNMARMRELQPKMEAIKEKYADDPQKQQQATMKMYKETGVNPIGGCLPMLLQYPIIIALWQFLQQSIEIRQQGFLWANDLSSPDVILSLPFTIPFYGDYVAGFTLLMALSVVLQMQMQSGSSNAQMKMMMYIMPFFLLVIFNRFPSGLSLYYLVYNVVTAIQQKFINKSIEQEKEEPGRNGKGSRRDLKAAKRTNGRAPKKGKSKQVKSR